MLKSFLQDNKIKTMIKLKYIMNWFNKQSTLAKLLIVFAGLVVVGVIVSAIAGGGENENQTTQAQPEQSVIENNNNNVATQTEPLTEYEKCKAEADRLIELESGGWIEKGAFHSFACDEVIKGDDDKWFYEVNSDETIAKYKKYRKEHFPNFVEGEPYIKTDKSKIDRYVLEYKPMGDVPPLLLSQEFNSFNLFMKVEKCESITFARVQKVGNTYDKIVDWTNLLDDILRPYFVGTSTEAVVLNKLNNEALPKAQAIKNTITSMPQCEQTATATLWGALLINRIDHIGFVDDWARLSD